LQHPAVVTPLERFGSPAQIRKAGRRRLVTLLWSKASRMAERLVEDIFDALDEQTVTAPGAEAAALIVPGLTASLTAVLDQRKLLAGGIEELLRLRGSRPGDPGLGSSPRGEQPSRRENKQLKRASLRRASTTPRPCSASPDGGPTSCSRRSATEPSTSRSRRPQSPVGVRLNVPQPRTGESAQSMMR
jgi:hypothetical protein